jgi:hypothetical protein
MAINALFCTDNSEKSVDFSGLSISVGSYITVSDFTGGSPEQDIFLCAQITDVTQSGSSFSATSNVYTSCYDCLEQNYTLVGMVDCLTESITLPVDITQFGYIPTINTVFNLIIDVPSGRNAGRYSGCYYVSTVTQTSEDEYINTYSTELGIINQIVSSNFSFENGCNECLYGFSAGTESTICVVCCPCTTGETISSVSAPHPTWTNGQGQAVIQLNAITLGGPNGLNN